MARLARTIADLSRYRRALNSALGRADRRAAAAAPPTRLREVAAFGSNPGNLRMLAYVPKRSPKGRPWSCAARLHADRRRVRPWSGWSSSPTGTASQYCFRSSSAPTIPAVLQLVLASDTGATRARRFDPPNDRVDDRGHGIDRRAIFVTGLSAGGAMASAMLAAYPEVFAGGAIIAGLPHGAANAGGVRDHVQGRARPARRWGDLCAQHRRTRTWPRISVWHGSADATSCVNRDDVGDQPAAARPRRDQNERTTGRGFERAVWRDHDGREVIEAVSIPGMAHGNRSRPDRVTGAAATRDRFCSRSASPRATTSRSSSASPRPALPRGTRPSTTSPPRGRAGRRVHPVARGHPPAGRPEPKPDAEEADDRPRLAIDVQAVIAKALRAAGLMRP